MIRKMTVKDYSAVYELWLSCKGMGLNDVYDSEEGIARFLARNLINIHYAFQLPE